MRSLAALLIATVVAVGCGDDDVSVTNGSDTDTSAPSAPIGDGIRHTATGTVLESPDHGPQLCLGAVAASLPPACGGPDVIGWDWDAVDGEESANGTAWGTYTVVGTWDGEALTLTEPPGTATTPDPAALDPEWLATPCAEPDGGWDAPDPAIRTHEGLEAATAYARAQPDVGGIWAHRSVVNVTFTGDFERHEAALRERWGGPLCVAEAERSAAELEDVRAEVETEIHGMLWSDANEVRGQVEVAVIIDEGWQQRFDHRYGPDVVDVQPALVPVDD